ncbi:MBL fold metallo-hydrolase [Paenibacillus yanchengensis]|uniref:MBL fold metallo-hydrolase n=1 Tax=Paenibacillus yanchengensis TaxID=2035833 RepID=A0ABW4YL32_9BACL
MYLNIQMLGTGSAFAKKYYNNNALIEISNKKILLDCGITLPLALHQAGYQFDQLDAILISHIHGDHIGGLEELAFQMLFRTNRKPKLYIASDLVEPLWEHTLRGSMTQQEHHKLEHYFDVHPLIANEPTEIVPGFTVTAMQTLHIPGKSSYSFIINDHFFYSADMQFNAPLLTQLHEQGVQTIFHDCQLEEPSPVHASLNELLTLPEEIQRKVWLMHYGDSMDDFRGNTGLMQIVEQGTRYLI